jgi:hypothetical protein
MNQLPPIPDPVQLPPVLNLATSASQNRTKGQVMEQVIISIVGAAASQFFLGAGALIYRHPGSVSVMWYFCLFLCACLGLYDIAAMVRLKHYSGNRTLPSICFLVSFLVAVSTATYLIMWAKNTYPHFLSLP